MKNNKEKRILVVEVNPDCKALRFDCDPFDDKDGMFCDKSGKWVRITEKDCAKCKSPVLVGITRSEAIERMAKGLYEYQYPKMRPYWDDDDNGHKEFYLKRAEAALNALLESKL